ncbi:MAG: succinate-semialdehyde dehydrogenase / glutarate-semialdehyde dehydrogenase [Solirubrobacteraceae bacterium]|jgi:succinate-semialdehyde dehydrogenase/glutarate-semialdehyde dehydrogenase|nr:succinate-semialdehyde dehydrogenase / glutarate-semialdehyde dehydrogenase [Solirubrobacteraceae bacterium]
MSTVSAEQAILDSVKTQLYIGGEWRDAGEGGTIPVEDPATGQTIAEVADATVEDAKAALGAAHETFQTFRDHPPRERGDILRRAYDLITERTDDLALLMTMEMGKPIAESKAEIAYAANFFRWYAEEAVRINGRFTINETGVGRVLTMQQPVGPCIFITPWNFPLAMGTRKIGPAVAAGCTMVVKPAKQTPLSMLALAQILEEAGLPGGVLNVITAKSSGRTMEPIIKDPRARKLSFTGSTEVGRELIRQSADQILRVSMELGGNAPFLIFDDADLDAAVEGALIAKMRNVGEACTAANRFHVAGSVADDFAERLAARIGEMKVGRGTEPGVKVGPLIDDSQRSKVDELVQDARKKGAKVLVGGEKLDGAGYFYKPTVITDVPDDAELLREEIFGPVAPVKGFDSEDEAIAAANDTEYGLVAYVYTRDINRAFRVMERLETGMIGLNQGMVSNAGAPFGGVKHSGYGREGGPEGMHEYLETKYVAINV